jgi:hypothetical protein
MPANSGVSGSGSFQASVGRATVGGSATTAAYLGAGNGRSAQDAIMPHLSRHNIPDWRRVVGSTVTPLGRQFT